MSFSMRKMRSLLVMCVCAMVASARGSNYDAYMADLDLRNREVHDAFRRSYPNGAYVLDYVVTSPDFYQVNPILREYESGEDYEDMANNDAWDRLLGSLAFARDIAVDPDTNMAAKRFQSWLSEQQTSTTNNTPARALVYPAYAGSEFAPQDSTWGTHRVSGGSSEVGRWMDYAVFGAQAQEEDEDDDREEVLIAPKPRPKSEVKMDQLPAYCDPPNPCPIGYDPAILATPCDGGVVNTAEFNRNWILRRMQNGECLCDEEHMESCPRLTRGSKGTLRSLHRRRLQETLLGENPYLRGHKRSDVVAKKNHHKPRSTIHENPYSGGNRLRSIVKKAGPRFSRG
ncbi:hypothetical protein ECG_02698 [Echinococcus granulosus]|uniref:Neuroendocrine protein 7B2 n=2 Tax=Echinococcus granulosus TaxID=6210 RepID=A0A068WVG6_ECHGR|nr:hypothetical protein ECG_02698 [Echinococcus granulosus]CDS21694.1 neuroendocrine protein 7b2 [Echinococcus granulosus]